MKDEFPEVVNYDHVIRDLISHIQHCDAEIDRANTDKQASEQKLRALLKHDNIEGSKTYDVHEYKVTVTTGLNYSFNKKGYAEYLEGEKKIDERFPLVKEVVELQLNKKAVKDLDQYGSPDDVYLKSMFVTTSDKKLHISIKKPKPKNEGV